MRRPRAGLTCVALALTACGAEPPIAPPRRDAGAPWDVVPVEDPCAPALLRELAADARRDGEAWVVAHDNAARATQGALLAPCATAEHVTVWRHVMTREARLDVAVESADPMETVAWVLDRCEPVLAEPLACAASAPAAGGARAAARTAAILRPGATVYVAVGGARRAQQAGAPRDTAGRFTLRVEEAAPLADGAPCVAGGAAECAADASCQRREVLAESFACVRDGASLGRCRGDGAPCDEPLRCIGGQCRGAAPVDAPCVPEDDNSCVAGAHCIRRGEAVRCIADGAAYGLCHTAGAACDDGLRCSGAPSDFASRCYPTAEDGALCDNGVDTLCAEGSTCVYDATMPGVPAIHCQRDGALGGACRAAEPSCDAGLACAGVPGSGAAALCAPARQVGEACRREGRREACVLPAQCILDGEGGVCRAPPYGPPEVVPGRALDACDGGAVLAVPAGAEHPAAAVALPFEVRFFGAAFDRIWPSRKGYAVLGDRAPRDGFVGGVPLAGEGPMVAPLLADLVPVAGARLCARVDAVERRVVLSWRGFSLGSRVGARVDVSAAVDAAGAVEFQYVTVAPGVEPLGSAAAPMSAGLQSDDGLLYLIVPPPGDGRGVRFTPR